jgi:hypothetical protein
MKRKYLLAIFLISGILQCAFSQIPNWDWARGASGNATDEASTVTTDTFGNIYISGFYSSDFITIGTVTLQNAGLSFNDIFLAKYNPSGNLLWAERFGGSDNDRGTPPSYLFPRTFSLLGGRGYQKPPTLHLFRGMSEQKGPDFPLFGERCTKKVQACTF